MPRLIPAAVAGVLVAAAAVWTISYQLHPFRLTPAGIRDFSAIYVLLTAGIAWTVTRSACRLLPADAATARQVALRTSMAALWLAPAALFLRDRSEWSLVAVAALVASLARLLRWLRPAAPVVAEPQTQTMFRAIQPSISFAVLAANVAAVLLVEGSVVAMITAHAALAAALVAAGTWLSVHRFDQARAESRRAHFEPRPPKPTWRLSLATSVTVLALLPHLLVPFGRTYGEAGGNDWSLVRTLKLLFGMVPGQPGAPGASSGGATVAGRDSGHAQIKGQPFPAVVLFPDAARVTELVAPPPAIESGAFGKTSAEPLTIPFYGAYWITRRPEQQPPTMSLVRHGSPTAQTFVSNDYRPLWMEAHQNLGAFIDLSCCRSMRVELTDADYLSNQVALEVVLGDSERGDAAAQSLGVQTVGTDTTVRPRPMPRELTFIVPPHARLTRFDQITVRFWLGSRHGFRSARVAIDRFVLVPRASRF